ncbi:MAG: SpoIID/LytB domain-containing protein [Gemmatimonadota bacterium]
MIRRGESPRRAWLALVGWLLLTACGGVYRTPGGAAPPAAETEGPRFAAEPAIRVGLTWGDSTVAIGSAARWWIHETGASQPIAVIDGAAPWTLVRLPFETAIRVRRPDGFLSEAHAGPLTAEPLTGGPLTVNGTAYPGAIDLLVRGDGTLTAVNVVPIETYLEGVVPKELGRPGAPAWEALRAQAVAARTYALKRLGSRAALGFDVFGTVQDQAYQGVAQAADSLAQRAVHETRGEALLYNGYLIDAFYHSTCGGETARVEQVFGGAPAPYLTAVSDAKPGGGYWCQASRYFRWSATFDAAELEAMVRRNLPGLVPLPRTGAGTLRDMELLAATPEGRALTVRVTTTTGQYLVGQNGIRTLFTDAENHLLRSTLFLFRPSHQGGRLTQVTLTGGGWGHGLGMCQVGAMGRSRAGQRYRDILQAYYPGVTIAALY